MDTQLFAITEYCLVHRVDASFIQSLEEEGLIMTVHKNEDKYVPEEQLPLLEIYTRWHLDMGVGAPGIEAMHHLVEKIKDLHSELDMIKTRLRFYEE